MIKAELVASSRVWSALALYMQSPARADTDLARRAFGLVLGTGHVPAAACQWGQLAPGLGPPGFRWGLARLWRSPRVCASGPPRRAAPQRWRGAACRRGAGLWEVRSPGS